MGLHGTAVYFQITSNISHTHKPSSAAAASAALTSTVPLYTSAHKDSLIRPTTTVSLQCRVQLSVDQPSTTTNSTLRVCRHNFLCIVHVRTVSTFSRVEYGTTRYGCQGQLNRKPVFALSQLAPEDLASRDGFGRPVLRQSAHCPYSGSI